MINNIHPSSDTYSLLGVTGGAGVVPSSDWERSRGILTFRPDATLTGNSRDIPKAFMFQNNTNNNNNNLNLIMNHSSYYICKQFWRSTPQKTPLARLKKKEENERMWRAREEEADRYCRPLFFTLWNSDVLPGDWFGRGEMDGNKMGGGGWNTQGENTDWASEWMIQAFRHAEMKTCVLWQALFIIL